MGMGMERVWGGDDGGVFFCCFGYVMVMRGVKKKNEWCQARWTVRKAG